MTLLLLGFLLPCLLSALLTALLIRLAPRLGLIDEPGERKVHAQPTPRGGGLAIYLAMLLALAGLAGVDVIAPKTFLVLGAGAVIVVLGLLDDRFSLSWQVRLVGQFVTTALVLGWPTETGSSRWLLNIIWVVGLINAFNMLDNMDALSAGTAWIAGLILLVVVIVKQVGEGVMAPYLVFLGAVAGFLWFNKPPARIFMGDTGSTFLGFFLAVSSLDESWAVSLCVLAVPWYDLITVVSLRLAQGRSPFHADKQHLSHRLVARGLPPRAAVGVMHGLALVSGMGGLLLIVLPDWSATILAGIAALWLAVALMDFVKRG